MTDLFVTDLQDRLAHRQASSLHSHASPGRPLRNGPCRKVRTYTSTLLRDFYYNTRYTIAVQATNQIMIEPTVSFTVIAVNDSTLTRVLLVSALVWLIDIMYCDY